MSNIWFSKTQNDQTVITILRNDKFLLQFIPNAVKEQARLNEMLKDPKKGKDTT